MQRQRPETREARTLTFRGWRSSGKSCSRLANAYALPSHLLNGADCRRRRGMCQVYLDAGDELKICNPQSRGLSATAEDSTRSPPATLDVNCASVKVSVFASCRLPANDYIDFTEKNLTPQRGVLIFFVIRERVSFIVGCERCARARVCLSAREFCLF
jgi:hypothetical protein